MTYNIESTITFDSCITKAAHSLFESHVSAKDTRSKDEAVINREKNVNLILNAANVW